MKTHDSILIGLLLTLMGIIYFVVPVQKKSIQNPELKELRKSALEVFSPIDSTLIDKTANKALIDLGRKLFLDKRLSVNDTVSCNSCHNLDNYGVDSQSFSTGHDLKKGGRNAPTVYNAALHLAQFWDGRAENLEAQALGPILNPVEMGMPSGEAVVEKVSKIEEYKNEFSKVFNNDETPLSFNNIGKAIAAFEKTLLTPTRFDQFLKGDDQALTEHEVKGLKTFMQVGCITCHDGPAVGGGKFMKLGFAVDYPVKDQGRFEITHNEEDRQVFKVPSLRNVLKTAPYFHDGSLKTVEEVIPIMAKHQLNVEVTKDQVAEIKTFLQTLVAEDLKSVYQ